MENILLSKRQQIQVVCNYNYKHTFSTVLMAVCDHEYKFSLVDVRSYGYMSDSGIFVDSLMSEGLFNGILHMTEEQFQIPNYNITTPLYLVGDNAFPFSTKLMKPFSGNFLGEGSNKKLKCFKKMLMNKSIILIKLNLILRRFFHFH